MQLFWFPVCFAYIILGVVQHYWATSLHEVEEPKVPLPRELEETLSEAEKEKAKAEILERLMTEEGMTEEGAMGYEDITFPSIIKFAKGFNKSTKINRKLIRLAALSFFIAAGVAFLQAILSC